MNKNNLILTSLLLAAGMFFAYAWISYNKAASVPIPLALQTSQENGVEVVVQPIGIGGASSTWNFGIGINTHSGDLTDNVATGATLSDGRGRSYPALVWEGDPPGGHHRRGILKFKPISPLPSEIVLTIREIGGVSERKFVWQIKNP